MNTSDLVAPRHLNRLAKIYVRQSSPHQVIHNTESQRMQYALHDRALGLGWHDNDIAIVDADLGISGASTEHRVGYQDLIAEIALGNVGILQVDLVFQTMLQKKTIAATTRWFRESDLLLPRQDVHGRIQWKRSTSSAIRHTLTNPAYAGAAVYGRSCSKTSKITGKKYVGPIPQEQWKYCVHDKFPAYISWEVFQSIQIMIQDNHNEYARKNNRGVPREGTSLLQGIVYCGHCGRKMNIRSQGSGRYSCDAQRRKSDAEVCQRTASERIDKQAGAPLGT